MSFTAADFSDPWMDLKFFAAEFGCSVGHLQNISLAQRGLTKKATFTDRVLANYPKFYRGPNGLGMYASEYAAWRREQGHPLPIDGAIVAQRLNWRRASRKRNVNKLTTDAECRPELM